MIHRIVLALASVLFSVVALADDRNSLLGTVVESGGHLKVGSQITFVDLSTKTPTVVWSDGYDSKMTKLFESPGFLVMQFVAPFTGSTDTVYLEKENKKFFVVSVGAMSSVPQNKPLTVSTVRGVIK